MLHRSVGFSQFALALFALAGAGGALFAPMAGRFADRGWSNPMSGVFFAVMAAMFLVTGWAVGARILVALVAAAVLIDASTQGNQIAGQRLIYGIAPAARGRINSAYIFVNFLGGATGSLLAPFVYQLGGWTAVAFVGAGIAAFVLIVFTTERIDRRQREGLAALES
jgi:predicted MFS family arabinose efflux permease